MDGGDIYGEYIVNDRGEKLLPDSKGELHKKLPALPVEAWDGEKAAELLVLLGSGEPLSDCLEVVGISKLTFLSWKRNHEEFATSVGKMVSGRREHLLERSYEQDLQYMYTKGADVNKVKTRLASLSLYMKMAFPECYQKGSLTVQNNLATLTINTGNPEEAAKTMESFRPKLEDSGAITL